MSTFILTLEQVTMFNVRCHKPTENHHVTIMLAH